VALASSNGEVVQATDFSGGAAIAGKAFARTMADITAAIATSKMMRFTGATSSGRAGHGGPASLSIDEVEYEGLEGLAQGPRVVRASSPHPTTLCHMHETP
jgi:hypothetical protein